MISFRRLFFALCFAATFALAGGRKAFASELDPVSFYDISSESSLIGTFGGDDDVLHSDVYSNFVDFLDSLDGDSFDYSWSDGALDVGSSVSGNTLYFYNDLGPSESFDYDYMVDAFANYDTYYGSIPSQYLEYMRGFLGKLSFGSDYVASRVSQYDYIFAFADSLSYSSGVFTGSDVTVIRWNTSSSNGSFSHSVESSFSLDAGNYLVYSNLTDFYPSLDTSTGLSSKITLFVLCICVLIWIINASFNVRRVRRVGRH